MEQRSFFYTLRIGLLFDASIEKEAREFKFSLNLQETEGFHFFTNNTRVKIELAGDWRFDVYPDLIVFLFDKKSPTSWKKIEAEYFSIIKYYLTPPPFYFVAVPNKSRLGDREQCTPLLNKFFETFPQSRLYYYSLDFDKSEDLLTAILSSAEVYQRKYFNYFTLKIERDALFDRLSEDSLKEMILTTNKQQPQFFDKNEIIQKLKEILENTSIRVLFSARLTKATLSMIEEDLKLDVNEITSIATQQGTIKFVTYLNEIVIRQIATDLRVNEYEGLLSKIINEIYCYGLEKFLQLFNTEIIKKIAQNLQIKHNILDDKNSIILLILQKITTPAALRLKQANNINNFKNEENDKNSEKYLVHTPPLLPAQKKSMISKQDIEKIIKGVPHETQTDFKITSQTHHLLKESSTSSSEPELIHLDNNPTTQHHGHFNNQFHAGNSLLSQPSSQQTPFPAPTGSSLLSPQPISSPPLQSPYNYQNTEQKQTGDRDKKVQDHLKEFTPDLAQHKRKLSNDQQSPAKRRKDENTPTSSGSSTPDSTDTGFRNVVGIRIPKTPKNTNNSPWVITPPDNNTNNPKGTPKLIFSSQTKNINS